MIITIDGPSGTGKSTIAKLLAERLGFVFFDTGAMYRALTYQILKEHIPLDDQDKISALLRDFNFRIETLSNEKKYYVGDEEVTEQIRSQKVTKHVSEVAALQVVRDSLVHMQRRFAENSDSVFEGRDMGTVVFPNAQLKIYFTASSEIRADRRYHEFLSKHSAEAHHLTKQQVHEDIIRRDAYDSSRQISPLRPAEDAYLLDTSHLTIDEVVEHILSLLPKDQGK